MFRPNILAAHKNLISRKQASRQAPNRERQKATRVLIVTGDQQSLKDLRRHLEGEFEVTAVRHGYDALRRLQSMDESVDVILFDLDNESAAGTNILERILEQYPHICTAALSDKQDVQLVMRLVRAGLYDFVGKVGTRPEYFSSLINKWLQEQGLDWKLGEYVRLHREVMRSMEVRTFLAIDVQKSFDLKARQDPFLSQYTFYLYHRFIERSVTSFGGKIHSTAGDGTMVCFEEPAAAISAANKIVTNLSDFNLLDNWLPQDFSLRLGIHTGPVVFSENSPISHLFSKTIDIAGHIQKDAHPNRVELSEESLSAIENKHGFLPTTRVVDGVRVYYLA